MSKELICATCGTRGTAKSITKGSLLIEIVLWLCFILPGLLYSLWRLSSRQKGCRTCGATTLVPLDSPAGRDLSVRYAQH